MNEENYPDVGLDATGRVRKEDDGWRWSIRLHVHGPDTWIEQHGRLFKYKKECLQNMLSRYSTVIRELLDQLN